MKKLVWLCSAVIAWLMCVGVCNAQGEVSLWPSTTPTNNTTTDASVELGLKWKTDVAGKVTGVRYYRKSGVTGTHTGSLWTSTGTLLARVTFTGGTSTGWQVARFSTPVTVTANTTYIVSYHAPRGYVATNYGMTSPRDRAPLHAPSSASAGGNGVYRYGTSPLFPNKTYRSSNYWVDLLFIATGTPTCSFTVSPTSLNHVAGGETSTVTITANISTCAWTVSGGTAWLHASPPNGTGSGSVTVQSLSNSGAARSVVLTIAGKTVTVSQAAPAGPAPLTVSCPANPSAVSPDGQPVTVTWPAPQTTGGTPPITVTESPTSGSAFVVGTTPVSVSASSSDGQNATCNFSVIVTDGSQQACTQTLAPGGNVSATVSAASPGSVICLNAGSYGSVSFSGIVKNPRVTVKSSTGQGASLNLTFQNGTNGLTVESVVVTGASLSGSTTRNITVQHSTFTGPAVFNDLVNSNVLLDQNTHNNINAGGQFSSPARLHLSYSGSTHSGVTIQNSLMDGGSADGVQTGVGVNILNNEFRNITEGSCGDCHTDAIQLLGANGSVVSGNYIHNVASGIVAYDGVSNAVIENNVVDTGGRPWGIELYSDSNSIVRHNTLPYRASCNFNLPCGILALDRKSQDPAGQGTIVQDNIATQIEANNGSTYAQRDHNLVRNFAAAGDLTGSPTYSGGALPATWAGYELTSGLGNGTGTGGTDIGTLCYGTVNGVCSTAP